MSLLASAQAAVQLGAQSALALLAAPFHAWARWLSLWLGVLLQALSFVGVAPTGYSPQSRCAGGQGHGHGVRTLAPLAEQRASVRCTPVPLACSCLR